MHSEKLHDHLWVANHRLSNSGLALLRGFCGVLFNPYRGSFSEVKRAGFEADQLSLSSAEARKTMYSTNIRPASNNPFVSILSLGKESKFQTHIDL